MWGGSAVVIQMKVKILNSLKAVFSKLVDFQNHLGQLVINTSFYSSPETIKLQEMGS